MPSNCLILCHSLLLLLLLSSIFPSIRVFSSESDLFSRFLPTYFFFLCMVSCAPFVSIVSFLSSSLAFTALSTESLFQLLVLNTGLSHPARAPQTPNTCLWSIRLWIRHSSIILSWEVRAVGHMLLNVGCVFTEVLLSTCRVPVLPCPQKQLWLWQTLRAFENLLCCLLVTSFGVWTWVGAAYWLKKEWEPTV